MESMWVGRNRKFSFDFFPWITWKLYQTMRWHEWNCEWESVLRVNGEAMEWDCLIFSSYFIAKCFFYQTERREKCKNKIFTAINFNTESSERRKNLFHHKPRVKMKVFVFEFPSNSFFIHCHHRHCAEIYPEWYFNKELFCAVIIPVVAPMELSSSYYMNVN